VFLTIAPPRAAKTESDPVIKIYREILVRIMIAP